MRARQEGAGRLKELTVVFDNVPGVPGLITGWGFAAVVRGYGRTVLFDAGSDGATLLSNLRALSIVPKSIDLVVLSHAHADHAGGLPEFLSVAPGVELIVPDSLPKRLVEAIEATGVGFRTADPGEELADGVTTTGSLPGKQIEQGLILAGHDGPALVTGCAHPGVQTMLKEAARVAGSPVGTLIGGFHLHAFRKGSVRATAAELREMGLERIAPSHCTGDRATTILADEFGEGFIESGLGRSIVLDDEGKGGGSPGSGSREA
ncbi:MAG: MBL fold metallo-hydrolase [Candidatus Eisenbacteria bacterium]|nr:MBL fold metallo-hydrolase [Candidatus Eisenbacteria bacterium]